MDMDIECSLKYVSGVLHLFDTFTIVTPCPVSDIQGNLYRLGHMDTERTSTEELGQEDIKKDIFCSNCLTNCV